MYNMIAKILLKRRGFVMKRIISLLIAVAVIACVCSSASAYTPSGFEVNARSALLISLDTDEVLFEKNSDAKVYPASITKIMTLIIMLESDRFDPDAPVVMSEEVDRYITGTGSAVSNLQVGEQIRQIDLCYYVLMSSAGDCA